MQSARPCAICGGSFSWTDAVIYLRAENVLMHRACCHLHPSCHCEESATPDAPTPLPDAASEETAAA